MNIGDIKRRVGRIIQKLLQSPIVIVQKNENSMPGAFIIAPPRSGTTLLRYILNSHSKIAAPPETELFTPLLSALDDERIINCMWNLGFHRDALAKTLGDCCRSFLEAYAMSKGKSFWIEKTPSYISILPKLSEAFRDAKFLMLYRHPFDIVRSAMDMDFAKVLPEIAAYRPYFSSDFATYCAYVSDQHEAMLRFQQKHTGVTLELRYEHITIDPERELKKICEFLGLKFEPKMIDFHDASHDTGFGDLKILKTKGIIQRTKTYEEWTPAQRDEAFKFLQKDLTALGYTV